MIDDIDDLIGVEKAFDRSPAGHRGRVRETIDRNPDFAGFSEYEMLEYLLFSVLPRRDTKGIAKDLIRTFGSLSAVLHADYYELRRIDGVGDRAAHLLANVLPIVLRGEYMRYEHANKLTTPLSAARHMYARFLGQTKEKLLMATLTLNDEVIQTVEIASGTADSAGVDIMKILRYADRDGAKKIILAHNHPGGTMQFSESDVDTTARVMTCCLMTDLTLYDHLIIYGNKYISMYSNDAFDKIFDACSKVCSEMSLSLTKERTYRSMLTKLRENRGSKSLKSKMEILSIYKTIFGFVDDEKDDMISALSSPIGEDTEKP